MAFRQPRKYSDDEYEQELSSASKAFGGLGRLRSGTFEAIESLADEMIRRSLTGVTKYADKADVLTPWKMQMRQRREVLTSSGFPDSSIRRGMYKREANATKPELNSREGIARARTRSSNVHSEQYHGMKPEEG